MKRKKLLNRGDLRLVAAMLATAGFAVLLNQPSAPPEPTWTDVPWRPAQVVRGQTPQISHSPIGPPVMDWSTRLAQTSRR